MSDKIETFFSAWSMTDADERAATIASAVAAAIRYADPRTAEAITDRDALSDYVGAFSANAPGWTATVVKSDQTKGLTRSTVAFGGKGPDGSDMVQHGQYFTEFDADGMIARMTGFVGTGAPE